MRSVPTKVSVNSMKRTLLGVIVAVLVLASSPTACQAADAQPAPDNPPQAAPAEVRPEGTWKWGYKGRDGKPIEAKVTLRRVDGKLQGIAVGPDGKELPLENVRLAGDQLRFQVSRQTSGHKFTTLYVGKITGDTIKGKSIQGREDTGIARDWEAQRVGGTQRQDTSDGAFAHPLMKSP